MSYVLVGPDEKPILRNNKEVYVQDFTSIVKGVNLEKRTLTIIGSDETRDRDGDIIRVSGWILENYLKNPVFLWAHNYSSVPLGATSQLIRRRNPNRLEFKDIRFPTEGLNPFADMILQLYEQQIINASSVGFLPYKWNKLEKPEGEDPPKDEPWMWQYGREYIKQELLELSGCPVPSNPSALQNAIKGFAGDELLTQNLLNCFNAGGLEDLKTKDDILEELRVKGEIEVIDEERPVQVQVPEKLENEEDEIKAVCGSRNLPTNDSGEWDGAAARTSIENWATTDGKIDFSKYKKGFVYQKSGVNADTKGAYILPFAKVIDGTLTAVWGGVNKAMGSVNGARGGADLGDDRKSCYSFLVAYYKKFDKEPPTYNAEAEYDEEFLKEITEELPEEGLKPYPNEHSCRLRNPDDFEKFRRGKREHDGKEYSIIFGKKKGEDSWAEQAYRYNKDTWTASEARKHCKDHNGSFEAATGTTSIEISFTCEAQEMLNSVPQGVQVHLHGDYNEEDGIVISQITRGCTLEEEGDAEKRIREFYSNTFNLDLSEKDFNLKEKRWIEGEDEGKVVISSFTFKEGRLVKTKEETFDSDNKLEVGERETKFELILSQQDKEWLAGTIKEEVKSMLAKIQEFLAKAPLEIEVESPQEDSLGMVKFREEMLKLKKIANEIEEVVKNATH